MSLKVQPQQQQEQKRFHASGRVLFNGGTNESDHSSLIDNYLHLDRVVVINPAVVAANTTLDLFHYSKLPSSPLELEEPHPLPFGLQRFLNLQTGEIYYKKVVGERQTKKLEIKSSRMNRKGTSQPKLDLKLNLSPPTITTTNNTPAKLVVLDSSTSSSSSSVSPNRFSTTSSSPTNSCVTSDLNRDHHHNQNSMMLVGCPSCLMYFMLADGVDPKCPKCKSTVLLHDFLHHGHNNNNKKTRKN